MRKTVKYLVSLCLLGILGLPSATCAEEPEYKVSFETINAEKAVEQMAASEDYILLDVRTEQEYEESHIPGAILIPLDTLMEENTDRLEDKEQSIFVYCRSGRRSHTAAEYLAGLGYTNVYDFGGIINWTGETETGPYVEAEETVETELKECESESDEAECKHRWAESCVERTCMKCGKYERIAP